MKPRLGMESWLGDYNQNKRKQISETGRCYGVSGTSARMHTTLHVASWTYHFVQGPCYLT